MQKVFYVIRLAFAVNSLMSVAIFIAYVPMNLSYGFTSNAIFRILGAMLTALLSVAILYLAHLTYIAFKAWTSREFEFLRIHLRKIVGVLYCTAFLDFILVVQNYTIGGTPQRSQEEILRDNPILASINEYKPLVLSILNYINPRPVGLAAILLAIFITSWLRRSSELKD